MMLNLSRTNETAAGGGSTRHRWQREEEEEEEEEVDEEVDEEVMEAA